MLTFFFACCALVLFLVLDVSTGFAYAADAPEILYHIWFFQPAFYFWLHRTLAANAGIR